MNQWMGWPATMVLVAALVQGCDGRGGETEPAPDQQQEQVAPTFGCEKSWNWQARGFAVLDESRDTLLNLTGPDLTQNIPEYHDCQRFVMGSKVSTPGAFSQGVFAIFAVPKDPGYAPFPVTPVYLPAGQAGNALPAAQIVAEAEYEPLSLEPGFNCLYLHRGTGNQWEARLRRDGDSEGDCSQPVAFSDMSDPSVWVPLPVERSPGGNPQENPVVARWIWHHDEASDFATYKMGVWCDHAWCEVGPPAGGGVNGHYGKRIPPDVLNTPQGRVPLWNDEQVLSHVASTGGLDPSAIVGTILPHPRLGSYTEADFSNTWQFSARVALSLLPHASGQEQPYAEKLNLALTDQRGPLNRIYLCRGDWESGCQENGVPEPEACESDDREANWWAKIERGGANPGRVEYSCVARCPYDIAIPGTARWQWREDDEVFWMRCINGCCEVSGGKH